MNDGQKSLSDILFFNPTKANYTKKPNNSIKN